MSEPGRDAPLVLVAMGGHAFMQKGEAGTIEDHERNAPVCLLGQKVKRELFGSQNAIQERVSINRRKFLLVGVFEEVGVTLGINLDDSGAEQIARRSRGTPRVANRLLKRVRDYADVHGDGHIDAKIAEFALNELEVDQLGLDPMDRRILSLIQDKYGGGPVGIDTLSAALSEEADTLEEVYEPFLLQEGLIQKTPRGRTITELSRQHLKKISE